MKKSTAKKIEPKKVTKKKTVGKRTLVRTNKTVVLYSVVVPFIMLAVFVSLKTQPQPAKSIPVDIFVPMTPVIITPSPGSKESIIDYIKEKFGSHAEYALCIANHESGFNPSAIFYEHNGTIDRGIFQINSSHHIADSILLDWKGNIDAAFDISSQGTNWNAWTTQRYCN